MHLIQLVCDTVREGAMGIILPDQMALKVLKPPLCLQSAVNYLYALGSEPLQEYPGGLYRAASTATFPVASALSGGLNILKPGGMRELHWHGVDEWAMVINGTCRGLVLEYGTEHPTNSWDWNAGDIWHVTYTCCFGSGPSVRHTGQSDLLAGDLSRVSFLLWRLQHC